MERFAAAPQPGFAPQPHPGGPQPNPDRPFYASPEKQGFERSPRQDRPFQDKSYQERSYADRPYGERNSAGRDQEGRGQRAARGPRDYRGESAPRSELHAPAPVEEIERNGLPAFITAPVRPQSEALGGEFSVETFPAALGNQPELEREVNGFHLRPRRRRRSKAEMAMDQAQSGEGANARDPVGD